MIYDLAILGGGASALMCAANISKKTNCIILEQSSTLGKKLLVSGGGKCNFTNENISTNNYLANSEFISFALESFTPKNSLNFFKNIQTIKRDFGKVFGKNSSKEFLNRLIELNQDKKIVTSFKVCEVDFKNDLFEIKSKDSNYFSKVLIVASGSTAWPACGVSDIGYLVAKKFGHSVVKTSPALAPMTLQKEQFWMKELSGTSIEARVEVEGKILEDSLLFTHKGISGPLALNISLFWKKGTIKIDFLPNLNVLKLLKSGGKKQLSSLLPLPKRFTKALLFSVNLNDLPLDKFSKEELAKIEETFHNYSFAPAGTLGEVKAEVLKGGVCTDEICPKSFESKLQKRLYFIGEVLNVTGMLGGYNLHWAFASGFSCAKRLS